jgi:hypothetical protein
VEQPTIELPRLLFTQSMFLILSLAIIYFCVNSSSQSKTSKGKIKRVCDVDCNGIFTDGPVGVILTAVDPPVLRGTETEGKYTLAEQTAPCQSLQLLELFFTAVENSELSSFITTSIWNYGSLSWKYSINTSLEIKLS